MKVLGVPIFTKINNNNKINFKIIKLFRHAPNFSLHFNMSV